MSVVLARSNLWLRVVSALVLIPCVLGIFWLPPLGRLFILSLVSLAVVAEWVSIATPAPRRFFFLLLGGSYLLAMAASFFSIVFGLSCWILIFSGGLFWKASKPSDTWVFLCLGGFLLISVGLVSFLMLSLISAPLALWVLLTVWLTDSGAYFVGRALGGPKLSPKISPNKTWSGFLGGWLFGFLVTPLFLYYVPHHDQTIWYFGAVLLPLASHVGDLLESWAKRVLGRKDSSQLLPGHGGLLDRVDGLLSASFMAFLLLSLWPHLFFKGW